MNMKIIISPAKQMSEEIEYLHAKTKPLYLKKSKQLLTKLQAMSYQQLKELLNCSDKIAQEVYQRYMKIDLDQANTPALLAYKGIQYQYMAPQVFEDRYYEYVQDHLFILSGLYGVLRPFDAITSYRLEMQAKLKVDECSNLYEFWKDDLYQEVSKDKVILNLASNEYSKCIKRHLKKEDHMVTCVFGDLVDGKVKEKGVYVKMARGEMVRFLAEGEIEDLEGVKQFNRLGFVYHEELSDSNTFVFIGTPNK